MQLTQENPGFAHVPRGVVPGGVLVDQRTLERSFLLAPDRLVEDWRPTAAADLQPADFDAEVASTLLKRPSSPQQIGAALRYLIDAEAVTGQMIAADSGQHLA